MLHSSRLFVNPVTFFRLTAVPLASAGRVAPTPLYPDWYVSRTESRNSKAYPRDSRASHVIRPRFRRVDKGRAPLEPPYPFSSVLFLRPFSHPSDALNSFTRKSFYPPQMVYPGFLRLSQADGNKKTGHNFCVCLNA